MSKHDCDVLIIGGGPAGATAALLLARQNFRVIVVEKSVFPRFHIGESMLPRLFPLLNELGLGEALRNLPHVPKLGVEFGMGNNPDTTRFTFQQALLPGSWTFNIERAVLDKMLLDHARRAGSDVRENTGVRRIDRLEENNCQATLDNGQSISARFILDASGYACVVGRHLNIRRPIDNPDLHKVAYFKHFQNVERLPGEQQGFPGIIMAEEGWFWLIPINEQTTSVGFVCDPDFHKRIGVPPRALLAWAIERCPVVRDRLRNAEPLGENQILADFSYTCKPCAGDGYFLLGDAAYFLDPIFSTGVTLAMMSAKCAAEQVQGVLRKEISPSAARRRYIHFFENSTRLFWHLIRNFYTHSFRELFIEGEGPCNVHGAVLSILAGQVFPRAPWSLRWRLWVFNLCMVTNRYFPMVPKRARFSLRAENPAAIGREAATTPPAAPLDSAPVSAGDHSS